MPKPCGSAQLGNAERGLKSQRVARSRRSILSAQLWSPLIWPSQPLRAVPKTMLRIWMGCALGLAVYGAIAWFLGLLGLYVAGWLASRFLGRHRAGR